MAKDLEEKNFDYAVLGKVLDADEKAVLQGRAKGLTYKQISDETGLRLNKARQLEYKALTKLSRKTGIALDDISRNLKGSMKDMKEAKDLETKNVDKALAHDCAKHVVHEQWGEGNCIPEMHSLEEGEDGVGHVTHYDVMFEHGIEQNVPVEDLEIVVSESHMHSKKKVKEEVELDEAGPKIDPAKMAAHMARNNKPKKMSSTQKSLAAIRQKAEEFESDDEVEGGDEQPQMDPVNKKAVKKKFKDRKDKDIDNDGDVDKSDKYLHMRRKAISKAIAKKKDN